MTKIKFDNQSIYLALLDEARNSGNPSEKTLQVLEQANKVLKVCECHWESGKFVVMAGCVFHDET